MKNAHNILLFEYAYVANKQTKMVKDNIKSSVEIPIPNSCFNFLPFCTKKSSKEKTSTQVRISC